MNLPNTYLRDISLNTCILVAILSYQADIQWLQLLAIVGIVASLFDSSRSKEKDFQRNVAYLLRHARQPYLAEEFAKYL